jgi:hypothetical protein
MMEMEKKHFLTAHWGFRNDSKAKTIYWANKLMIQ